MEKQNFILTKDSETKDMLLNEGFEMINYCNGIWTFLNSGKMTFSNKEKIVYSNMLTV